MESLTKIMNELLMLRIVIVSMMSVQIFIGYYSEGELIMKILLKERGQMGHVIAWGLLTTILLIMSAQIVIFLYRFIKTKEEIRMNVYLYTSVIFNFMFMFYHLNQYFNGHQKDVSLAFGAIIVILQLMLIPLSYAHQKLTMEENFYKRNLAFVNSAFILTMGFRGSERDDRERIQNNVIEDLPSLHI